MHRTCLIAAAVAAVMSAGGGNAFAFELAEGQVRIELHPQITAQAQEVRMGDIAYLYATDLGTIQRLAALSLGHAPAVGTEAVVRRDVIARWVHSKLGIGRDQVVWSGPDETHVRTLAQHLPAARLERAAQIALGQWLDRRTSRYGLDALALPGDIKLPAGSVQLKARPLAADAVPTARMVVWMDVEVDGRFVRTVPVSFAVDAYRDAWVAPVAIPGGVALAPGMVEKREVQVTGHAPAGRRAQPSPPAEMAGGWRTTRALREGEPVTTQNTAPAPAIARGAWVALHLKSGVVELEGRAQAMQDGELGQTVKVRSSSGGSPVDARVVAPGHVEATL